MLCVLLLVISVNQRLDLSPGPAQVRGNRVDVQAGVEVLHDNLQEARAGRSCRAGHEERHWRCKLALCHYHITI